MDLLDVIRIAARRWYVVGAILLVGVTAALVLASTIAPEYRVETQSILISGQVPSSQPGVDEPGNPYLAFSGSLFTTLSAVTRTVDGQEYRAQLGADGSDRDFDFSTSQEAPVIITEATADTPDDALELANQVQDALSETLVTLQSEENVPTEQQIFMRVLTTSEPQLEVGNRNRVLFGMLGLSFAASIGGAVLVESILQSRKKNQDDPENQESDLDEHRDPSATAEHDSGAAPSGTAPSSTESSRSSVSPDREPATHGSPEGRRSIDKPARPGTSARPSTFPAEASSRRTQGSGA